MPVKLKHRFLSAVIDGKLGTQTERGLIVTAKEFKAYFENEINDSYLAYYLPSVTKVMHLALLGVDDPGERYQNCLEYLIRHVNQPFDPWTGKFNKEVIPKPFITALNLKDRGAQTFLDTAVFKPLGRYRLGQPLQDSFTARPETIDKLEYIENHYYLLPDEASRMLSVDRETSFRTGPHFFEHTDDTLFLRNVLVFTNALMNADRQGGRIQNAIPVALTKRLNITRLSIPQLMMAADVISLMVLGLLDVTSLSGKADFMGLKSFNKQHLKYPSEIISLAKDNLNYKLMDQGNSVNFSIVKGRGMGGIYDTGIIFNCHRLLQNKNFKAFKSYYEAIDDLKLKNTICNNQVHDKELVGELYQYCYQAPDEFTGVRLRDLVNGLSYLYYMDADLLDAAQHLPYVSQWAFGLPEAKPSTRTTSKKSHKSNKSQKRSNPLLPLIESLMVHKKAASYILYPGYNKDLPAGRVHFPRCLVATYEALPEQIVLVGENKLGWGSDPFQQTEIQELIRQGAKALQ